MGLQGLGLGRALERSSLIPVTGEFSYDPTCLVFKFVAITLCKKLGSI